ncbi:hypothetical protein RRG08_024743 [Elysia crispata]|uniref:Uncharacterized protein n=1 Tax=Elysia crispata TaxID=231223 RepID=A0AAE1CXI1_9GAST|nr:hypothetical protein RRG08_024743 [Elysia crispata]
MNMLTASKQNLYWTDRKANPHKEEREGCEPNRHHSGLEVEAFLISSRVSSKENKDRTTAKAISIVNYYRRPLATAHRLHQTKGGDRATAVSKLLDGMENRRKYKLDLAPDLTILMHKHTRVNIMSKMCHPFLHSFHSTSLPKEQEERF